MIKSTIKATLADKAGDEYKLSITIDNMDVSEELASTMVDKVLEALPNCKKYYDGKVKTDEVDEFEFFQPDKSQKTIFEQEDKS